MKKNLPSCAVAALCSFTLFSLSVLHAQVPQIINYQGRVAVGAVNFHGSGQFKFALVDGAGTTFYWTHDNSVTLGIPIDPDSIPDGSVALSVTKGLYSVLLGDTSLAGMTAISPSIFANSDVRLRVWFNDGANGFQLLTPDQRIAAVGYAMVAGALQPGNVGIAGTVTASNYFGGFRNVGNGGSFSLWDGGNVERGTLALPEGGGQYSNDATGNDIVLRAVTGKLLLQSGDGASAIAIDTNNNVGIGTATPTAKLEVAGTVKGTAFVGDGSGLTGVAASTVGGLTAANVASGADLANAATTANTPNTIVKRDASGNFAADTCYVFAYHGRPVDVPHATRIPFNDASSSSGFSTTSGDSFQIPVTGVYAIDFMFMLSSWNAPNPTVVQVLINGTAAPGIGKFQFVPPEPGEDTPQSGHLIAALTAGAEITIINARLTVLPLGFASVGGVATSTLSIVQLK